MRPPTSVLASGVSLVIALVAPGALAETGPGRLRLPTGSVMVGVITETTDFDLLVHLAPHLVTDDREPSRCGAAACGPPTPGPLGFVGISLGMGLGL